MSLRNHRRRRGSVVVYGLLALAIAFPFLALTIDLGRIAVARAELQNAADAAALAGAKALRDGQDAANTAAEIFGELNSVNGANAEIVTANDVEIGRWNKSTRAFQTLSGAALTNGNANAVRATCRINTERGNELPLFFAPLFGEDLTELEATAVACADNPFCSKIIGRDAFSQSGTSYTDSYDSSDGSYNILTAGQNGTVCTNNHIVMSGYAEINGDAHPGVGKLVLGSGTVTGTTEPLTEPLVLPPVSFGDVATNNDNDDIPLTDNGAPAVDAYGILRVNYGDGLTLPAGIYYFAHAVVTGTLDVSGRAIIYVTGNVGASGFGKMNADGMPSNLQIYSSGGVVAVSGWSEIHAAIYAPNARITRSGSASYFGMTIGREIVCSGDGGIHADDSLGNLYGLPWYPTLVE
jgi:hypothetical protein